VTENTIEFSDFQKVDVRVGVITEVEDFPRARNPSYKLTVDFGPEIGVKRSSAQVTTYTHDELRGTQVIAVVNFEPRNIAGFMSEVLVLGVPDADGNVVLLTPTREAVAGGRMY
jgi:tRNA-binding protein